MSGPSDRPLGEAASSLPMSAKSTRDEATAAAPLPEWIGPYRVISRLGHGGMGTVYKAEQREPVRRTVAVKVVKLGFDTTEVIARFQSERQAMARMDHPNIARVLDAGADQRGRPYFVMDFVPGSQITRFADENRLSIEQRLALMTQVCDGIGHAHSKAILHRDIKAGNVLAYSTPEGPRVKVIDFGVAKALTIDRLTDQTFNTARGQAIGTYEYMSPEQADGSLDIDTRADVYSLGVLLYELLSGSKPFDRSNLSTSGDEEIRRIIREQEPPRPSTQFSTMGDTATKIAQVRQIDVEGLTRKLKSELDWIPLMAMRKERDRRYATPQQMSQDIQNYLLGNTLIAAPDSTRYRLRKFVRRNRGLMISATTILLMLLLGIGGATLGLIGLAKARNQALVEKRRAETALAEATAQTAIAEAVSDFQTDMLRTADPDNLLGDKVTVLQAITAAQKQLDNGESETPPLVETNLRSAIGKTLVSLGRYTDAEPNFRKAVEIQEKLLPAGHLFLTASLEKLANCLLEEDRSNDAAPVLRALLDNYLGLSTKGVDLSARSGIRAMPQQNDTQDEALYRDAIRISRPMIKPGDSLIVATLSVVGRYLQNQERFTEADAVYQEALRLARRAEPAQDAEVASQLNNLASSRIPQKRWADVEALLNEALSLNKKTLPIDHPSVGIAMNNLAVVLMNEGKFADAESLFFQSLKIARKSFPSPHPTLVSILFDLGLVMKRENRLADAEGYFRESLDMYYQLGSIAGESNIAFKANDLADVLTMQNKFPAAEVVLQRQIDICRNALPAGDPRIAVAINQMMHFQLDKGHQAKAGEFARQALSAEETSIPRDELEIAGTASLLSKMLLAEGKPDDAEPCLRKCLEIRTRLLGPSAEPTTRTAAALDELLERKHTNGASLAGSLMPATAPATQHIGSTTKPFR